MELTEEHEQKDRSGIENFYYGQVNNVINLKLDSAQMKGIYEDIRQMLAGSGSPKMNAGRGEIKVQQAEIHVESPGNFIAHDINTEQQREHYGRQ